MRPNGAVKMTSKDATMHTMHAAGDGGPAFFNVSIPVPNVTLSRPIDKAGLVTLSCSTHTWMRGYLLVSEDSAPPPARTDDTGSTEFQRARTR